MLVKPIVCFNQIKYEKSKLSINQNVSPNTSRAESFSNLNEISGRYLAFKGLVSDKEKEIVNFIDNEINPFLQEYKEINNKNRAIYEASEKLTDLYWRGLVQIKSVYSPDAVITNDSVVVKNLEVPIKYQANLKEYKYLTNPENSSFMSEETKNFAKEIKSQMRDEKLDSYDDALTLMKKVVLDIKNGQSNALEHTSKSFNVKLEGTKQAKELAYGGIYVTDTFSFFKNRYEKLQQETNSTVKNKKIVELHKEVSKLKNLLRYAKESLKGRTEEAETLINFNNLTECTVKEQLERVNERYKNIADKNIKVLHEYFKEHPELIRDEIIDKKDEEFLKKQEYLNIKLWQHLQDDIKDINQESAKKYEEFQARRENGYSMPINLDDTDLPF